MSSTAAARENCRAHRRGHRTDRQRRPGGVLGRSAERIYIEYDSNVSANIDLMVGRVEGRPVRLRDLPVNIERRYQEPVKSLTRVTRPETGSEAALIVGVSMKSGRNIAEMSAAVSEVINQLRTSLIPPDIQLERVNDLPRQVGTRIVDFEVNLLRGRLIVLGVALLTMGWRPALIMAAAVPLSMICAFAVVRYFGIELEQFPIASLIIALGMVVDNAIVVSDNAVRLIRQGRDKLEAVITGTQDLAIPESIFPACP
jgi:multidrug efflux pump subunit AcrB